ncbi:hypothetical protein HPSH465_0681 [Glaesserella parasuis H465]|nr:hypothetical protein HPSH465_0681 [Glaesserella parasuis H465]
MLFSFNAFAEENKNLADIQFKDLDNNIVSLEKYKGKNVYVKMWASWCPICLAGLAEIDDLSADQNKNFEVITIVSPDKKGEKSTEKFIEWYKGLDYKNVVVLLDEQGEVLKRAKVRGYPSNVFLDSELTVKKVVPGQLSTTQITESINSK